MTDRELAEAVLEYEDAKAAEAAATERRQDAQDRVATLLESAGYKSQTVDYGDRRLRVTRSQSDYIANVDEKGLKKALGAKIWRAVSVTKLSQPLLKSAIERGEVDPLIAGQYLEVKQKTPTISLSLVKEEQ
jgi:ribosomal protein S1